jgi:hypothetical protein
LVEVTNAMWFARVSGTLKDHEDGMCTSRGRAG